MPWITKVIGTRGGKYARSYHGCSHCPATGRADPRAWRRKGRESLELMQRRPCPTCRGRDKCPACVEPCVTA